MAVINQKVTEICRNCTIKTIYSGMTESAAILYYTVHYLANIYIYHTGSFVANEHVIFEAINGIYLYSLNSRYDGCVEACHELRLMIARFVQDAVHVYEYTYK